MPKVRITATVILDDGSEHTVQDGVVEAALLVTSNNSRDVGDGMESEVSLNQFAETGEQLSAIYGPVIKNLLRINPGFLYSHVLGTTEDKMIQVGSQSDFPLHPPGQADTEELDIDAILRQLNSGDGEEEH